MEEGVHRAPSAGLHVLVDLLHTKPLSQQCWNDGDVCPQEHASPYLGSGNVPPGPTIAQCILTMNKILPMFSEFTKHIEPEMLALLKFRQVSLPYLVVAVVVSLPLSFHCHAGHCWYVLPNRCLGAPAPWERMPCATWSTGVNGLLQSWSASCGCANRVPVWSAQRYSIGKMGTHFYRFLCNHLEVLSRHNIVPMQTDQLGQVLPDYMKRGVPLKVHVSAIRLSITRLFLEGNHHQTFNMGMMLGKSHISPLRQGQVNTTFAGPHLSHFYSFQLRSSPAPPVRRRWANQSWGPTNPHGPRPVSSPLPRQPPRYHRRHLGEIAGWISRDGPSALAGFHCVYIIYTNTYE